MPTRSPFLSPLCQLPAGITGRVCELRGEDDFRQRLRELGFSEAALVTKISGSTTSLCQLNGTRIALSHTAAMNILVERLPVPAPAKVAGPIRGRPDATPGPR
ncbi:MAG TPA: FeoA family protein [Candidatus Didemnitutus sp.]|nr:FeoA family protein [Candidatus Didemnitutus sp.]